MKILSRTFFKLLIFILVILNLTVSAEAAKKIVAVMPMENVSGYDAANVAEIMTEQLIVTIINSGQYTAVERTQMASVLREQGFESLTGGNSKDEDTNLSGADYTVVGKITMAATVQNTTRRLIDSLFSNPESRSGIIGGIIKSTNARKGKIELDVRFVDNRTGEIVFAKTFSGSKSGQNDEMALHEACKEAAENFLKELQELNPFVARVEDISGNDIYIDQGSDSGLRKGEVLIVARETVPITVKGKIVGMKNNAICRAKVTEVNSEYAICKVDKASAVKKGDIVRRDSK